MHEKEYSAAYYFFLAISFFSAFLSSIHTSLTRTISADFIVYGQCKFKTESKCVHFKKEGVISEWESFLTTSTLPFAGHQGFDLYDAEQGVYINLRIRKTATFLELTELIASTTRYSAEKFRVWPMAGRTNNTMRPKALEWETDMSKTVAEVADSYNPWTCFLELLPADSGVPALPSFQQDRQVLLFFKYYDPINRQIHYAGHHYALIKRPLADLVPVLLRRAGLAPHTQLELFEEVRLCFSPAWDQLVPTVAFCFSGQTRHDRHHRAHRQAAGDDSRRVDGRRYNMLSEVRSGSDELAAGHSKKILLGSATPYRRDFLRQIQPDGRDWLHHQLIRGSRLRPGGADSRRASRLSAQYASVLQKPRVSRSYSSGCSTQ